MLKLLLVGLIATAVGAIGCAKMDSGTPQVEILPSIATRITGLHFDPGDQIGLSITKASAPYVENQLMTYNGSAFTSPGLLWYEDLSEKATLTAYHPYALAGMPGDFSVATDQTTNYDQSDLLGARKVDVTPGGAPVGMIFRHLLSEVRIVVANNSTATVSKISVGGSIPAAEVDLSSLSVRVRAGVAAADIRANEVTADAAYRVILVPQTARLTINVQMSDGKSHSKSLASALLDGGKCYDVALLLTNTDISISLNGNIEDWGEGGVLPEDEGSGSSPEPGPDTDQGLVYDGVTYSTCEIDGRVWMAENLRYQPEGTTLGDGVCYSADGASVVTTQGLLYDYATATGGTNPTTGPVQGICPAGWHLPTIEELTALKDSNYGSDFFVTAGCRIVMPGTSRYEPSDSGWLMSAPLNDEGKYNCLLYGAKEPTPELRALPVTHCVTVRCVKNE